MSLKPKEVAAPSDDRRADPRLATRLKAVIVDAEHGERVFTASGFNRRGAFLQRLDQTTALPPIGGVVQLTFHWPLETHMPPVRIEATVIHQAENGVGVKFDIGS